MGVLEATGLSVNLPRGWDGRIYLRQEGAGPSVDPEVLGGEEADPSTTFASLQAANVPLPPDTADFGGGAVELLDAEGVFLTLFEYGPDAVGTALFANAGLPRPLSEAAFSPSVLQRTLPDQAGAQLFFTEAGRTFSLYVVLGSYQRRGELVPVVNRVLESVVIEPRPSTTDRSTPPPPTTTTTTTEPPTTTTTTTVPTDPTVPPTPEEPGAPDGAP
jgi:hypothetical protein